MKASEHGLYRFTLAAILVCMTGMPVCGSKALAQTAGPVTPAQPAGRDVRTETLMKITAPFTVAAVGDIYEPRPLVSDDPAFQKLVDRIRKADVGFANMESSLIDFRNFEGPVSASPMAPLQMGEAMKAMGITIVNHANNHTLDGGVAGMVSTDEELDKLGIVHAGTGRNLQEARAAQFLESPKGRIGVVGMFTMDDSSKYGPNFSYSAATYRNGDLGGAPGVDALHLTAYHIVSAEHLESLKQIAKSAYGANPAAPNGAPERFRFFDDWYQAGPEEGAIQYEMNANDEKDILQSIRNGKVYADFVIATLHSHQTSDYKGLAYGGVDHMTPAFLVKLAHESLDNGADMFVAHGVHSLRGVEVYHGKPIFYGLSSFVFQFGLQPGPSYDAIANEKQMAILESSSNQETVLTTSHFENGRLTEVRLYPVDLGGARRPISEMGIPMTPSPDEAQRILKEMQDYSKAFGTTISIENNVGVIRIGPEGASINAAQK